MERQRVENAPKTSVCVETICDCPFSIAQDYAVEYLRRAEAGGPEAVMTAAPFIPIGRKVKLSFGLSADISEGGRQHEEIRVLWFAGSKLFPDFRGTIRFRIDGRRTLIIVEGRYVPPLGWFGNVFNRLVGRWIATLTLDDLARRLCVQLERRERLWRAANETVPG